MKLSPLLILSLTLAVSACSPTTESSAPLVKEQAQNREARSPAIKIRISPHNFTETVARVDLAISKRPLNLFVKIDHAAGAAKAELTLPPSTLFIFGNPKGGTPLMQRNLDMGIVLPLKFHVFQDGKTVKVNYTDIEAEAALHGLDITQQPIPNIAKMLSGLADEVTE